MLNQHSDIVTVNVEKASEKAKAQAAQVTEIKAMAMNKTSTEPVNNKFNFETEKYFSEVNESIRQFDADIRMLKAEIAKLDEQFAA